MSDLMSRPYKPDPARCCEACAFGRGEHAEWCVVRTCAKPPQQPVRLCPLCDLPLRLNPQTLMWVCVPDGDLNQKRAG
jgi:hypothetical protein